MPSNDTTHATPARGIILFAHGSRDPLWRKPMEAVAERILASEPQVLVTCAYLEINEPDLPTAAQSLIGKGALHLTIVPLFLGVGKHARTDLPLLMDSLREKHPQVEWLLQPAVGEHPQVIALLAQIALQDSP